MALRKVPFTGLRINTLKCPVGFDQIIYWDSKTPNLGLRVTKSQNKSYVFERWFKGKSMRMTIGSTQNFTIIEAQAEVLRLKELITKGIDPREEKVEQRLRAEAKRMKRVLALEAWNEYLKNRSPEWSKRYISDHLEMVREGGDLITRGRKIGMSTIKEPGILRLLLDRPIREVTRDSVITWLNLEKIKRPARTRLALALLKTFMLWLSKHLLYKKLVQKNIFFGLSKQLPKKKSKVDYLKPEELYLWFKAVRSISNIVISNYLQILLLTGLRREELSTIKWTNIDENLEFIKFEKKYSNGTIKNRELLLTPFIKTLICELPKENEYIFSSKNSKSGCIQEPRIAYQIAMKSVGLRIISIEGLRRSFRSFGEWVGCSEIIIDQIIGKKNIKLNNKNSYERPIKLLFIWHNKIEDFIVTNAGLQKKPD